MDLLFKRYASPFIFVDQMILTSQFSEFVTEIIEMDADDNLWQFFLHKVDGKTFDEWKESLTGRITGGSTMTQNEVETTINESFDILNGFEPTS